METGTIALVKKGLHGPDQLCCDTGMHQILLRYYHTSLASQAFTRVKVWLVRLLSYLMHQIYIHSFFFARYSSLFYLKCILKNTYFLHTPCFVSLQTHPDPLYPLCGDLGLGTRLIFGEFQYSGHRASVLPILLLLLFFFQVFTDILSRKKEGSALWSILTLPLAILMH